MNGLCSVTANSGIASMERSRKIAWIVVTNIIDVRNKRDKK